MKILVVEDEAAIAEDIASSLRDVGYAVQTCANGEDAWFLGGTEFFDAIILDLGLSRIDGLEVLRRWRNEALTVPVIILTARSGWTERVLGINAGADDYMVKPFEMDELIARVRAVLRRAHGHASSLIKAGKLELDINQMSLSVDGQVMALTPLEFRLISYLLHNKQRVVAREELKEHIYGDDNSRDDNAVEVLITRLRRKLGVEYIETRRGHGYCLKAASV
jgi:two-component system, OmpR family, response regulator